MADKVAYIGIGHMGGPMAMHLADAGYDLAVYDINVEKMNSLVTAHCGRPAKTAMEAAAAN